MLKEALKLVREDIMEYLMDHNLEIIIEGSVADRIGDNMIEDRFKITHYIRKGMRTSLPHIQQ